jgi:hypothetical protein
MRWGRFIAPWGGDALGPIYRALGWRCRRGRFIAPWGGDAVGADLSRPGVEMP